MKEQDIFFDPEKPEENLLDPDTLSNRFINLEEELKKLWDKEDKFLKSLGIDPSSK